MHEWIWGESEEGLRMVKKTPSTTPRRKESRRWMYAEIQEVGQVQKRGEVPELPLMSACVKTQANDSNFLHCLVSCK